MIGKETYSSCCERIRSEFEVEAGPLTGAIVICVGDGKAAMATVGQFDLYNIVGHLERFKIEIIDEMKSREVIDEKTPEKSSTAKH